MTTDIYYYTGTGNSLWVARTIAAALHGAEVSSMVSAMEKDSWPVSEVVGFVFPVHAWGLPSRVISFARQIGRTEPRYLFAVAVHAGQVSDTLLQLNRVLRTGGLRLSSGFEVKMPSNYIPWGGPGPAETQKELIEAAKAKANKIASIVARRKPQPIEKGPLWERLILPPMYRLSLRQMPRLDRNFWADEKCNACGLCVRVCPARNVALLDDRPVWDHRCEQCFRCLQWCPTQSIQYGKKTPQYERYHHPAIQLPDILRDRVG